MVRKCQVHRKKMKISLGFVVKIDCNAQIHLHHHSQRQLGVSNDTKYHVHQKVPKHFYDYLFVKTTEIAIVKHSVRSMKDKSMYAFCSGRGNFHCISLAIDKIYRKHIFASKTKCLLCCSTHFHVALNRLGRQLFDSMRFNSMLVFVSFFFLSISLGFQNKVSKLPYLKHLSNHSCDYCQRKIGHFVFFC